MAADLAIDDATAGFAPVAVAVGEAWATELMRILRAAKRDIVGSWPGTMSEARMKVLARLNRKLDAGVLDELARMATLAARRTWHHVARPDLEP